MLSFLSLKLFYELMYGQTLPLTDHGQYYKHYYIDVQINYL